MSLLVTIDSNGRTNGTHDDFIQYFPSAMELRGTWEMGLYEAYVWYSWFNISSEYGNNELRYHNGSDWVEVTIPNGNYNIYDIDAYLKQVMKANGDYDSSGVEDAYYINIYGNANTLKVEVTISNSYQLDLSVGSLHELLGFESQILNASKTGENLADITRGVHNLAIQCDQVEGSYLNGLRSNTIYTFVPNVVPGALMKLTPNNTIYLPVRSEYIYNMRMHVTDQDNRKVTFNDAVSYTLHFRKISD